MINRNLIKTINSGECVLFVGSGASCSAGLPSWKSLVGQLLSRINTDIDAGKRENLEQANKHYQNGDMIKSLDNIEKILGRDHLIGEIAEIFTNTSKSESEIYKILASWPFKFFMTTNYDSLLMEYLERSGIAAVEKGNSYEEIITIHSSVRNVIYKIHGDFSSPDTIIITTRDYEKLCSNKDFEYWREKIRSAFHSFPILIVGYSANDPDFREQLEYAREFADPNRPICMIVSDISPSDSSEFAEQNILIIPYDNGDGTHNNLTRLLKIYDSFIQRRDDPLFGKEELDEHETEIASSLYFYNRLLSNDTNSVIERAFCNVILKICLDEKAQISLDLLGGRLKQFGIINETVIIHDALMKLIEQGLLMEHQSTKTFSITEQGKTILLENSSSNQVNKEQFIKYCTLYLQSRDEFDANQIDKILSALDKGITTVFRYRGFEIAKTMFCDNRVMMSSSTDLLGELNKFATDKVLTKHEYIGFIELILDLFEYPSQEVQEYFGKLINGYFLYHVLGQNVEARKIRLQEIQDRYLLIDSSILISILAQGFINYDISNDLIKLIDKNGIAMYYTDKLLTEVVNHADWALRNYGGDRQDSLQFYNATFGSTTRNNLFVDGFLIWSIGKGPIKLKDYLEEILGFNTSYEIGKAIEKLLIQKNIRKLNFSDARNIVDEEVVLRFDDLTKMVTDNRKAMKTFRSIEQCETEAELMMISEIHPINFLTRSKSLVELAERKYLHNWLPEVMFRFLSLNDTSINPVSLYKCMYGDLIAAGFNVIEKDDLKKYIQPLFNQARAELKQQKIEFRDVLENYVTEEIIKAHEENYTLPLFVRQTAFYVSKMQKEIISQQEKRIKNLSEMKTLDQEERVEYLRLKSRSEQRKRTQENKKKKKKKSRRK